MSAYKSVARKVKDALVTVLSAVTYDVGNGSEPAFVAVLDNTTNDAEGYPILRVLPNNVTPLPSAIAERDRQLAYSFIIELPLENQTVIPAATYNQALDLSELIIDAIDNGDFDGALTAIDPTIPSWMMDMKQVSWNLGISKTGAVLLCTVDVQVSYSHQLM